MLALEQCPTCEMVITDSEEYVPYVQTEEQTRKVKLDPKIIHEVEPLAGKFHDRDAQQQALSNLESARTHFDTSKLRISFNR